MPWRNLVNEKYPEVMEQIHRDLTLGYEVLGIPQNNYKINLYDHGIYSTRNFRYGEVNDEDRCLDFYLSDMPVETEEDKANMSFVVWCTLRFWFRYECVKTWNKEHKLLPFVTDEDIERHKDFLDPICWNFKYPSYFNRPKFGEQFSLCDMNGFGIMMMRRYCPQYIHLVEKCIALAFERANELEKRYFGT